MKRNIRGEIGMGRILGKNWHVGRNLIRVVIEWRRRARPSEILIEGRRRRKTEYMSRNTGDHTRSTEWKRKEAW